MNAGAPGGDAPVTAKSSAAPATSPTAIHCWVDRCRVGDYASLVARLDSGWVVMGERQVFAGYCLLLPDPVVPHLNALSGAERAVFLDDMARVGDALLRATGALRINYALFGNVEPALHAHVFPRGVTEPEATRELQPWALDWSLAPAYSEADHGEMKRRLTALLTTQSVDRYASGRRPSNSRVPI